MHSFQYTQISSKHIILVTVPLYSIQITSENKSFILMDGEFCGTQKLF